MASTSVAEKIKAVEAKIAEAEQDLANTVDPTGRAGINQKLGGLYQLLASYQTGQDDATASNPKTIVIYDPNESPSQFETTFKNASRFDKWMSRSNTSFLFQDGKPPAISNFDDLADGALYTVGVCSIPARVKNLESHRENTVRGQEYEFALAARDYFAQKYPDVKLRPELRVLSGAKGDEKEVDVVLSLHDEFEDEVGFVFGSKKTTVSGGSDVEGLVKKVQKNYAHQPQFQGRPLHYAFMAEHVKDGKFDALKKACKLSKVHLFERNGRSISRVQMRGSAGMVRAFM